MDKTKKIDIIFESINFIDITDRDEKTNLNIINLSKNALKLLNLKPFSEFSETETGIIYKFYSSLEYFKNIPNTSQEFYRRISCVLKIRKFENEEYIYHIGEKSKFFYLILKGSVSILMPLNSRNEDDSFDLHEIFNLKQGNSFGEFSIFFNKERY